MTSRRRLIAIGLVTFIAGLIVVFPARVAYHWFAPEQIAVGGISGSVWSGTAQNASSSGVYVTNLSWRFKPLRLFTGKLAYAVAARPATGFVEADVGFGFGGAIHVTDLQGAISLQLLEQLAVVRGIRGDASLRFERLTFKDGIPVAAEGAVEVSNLVIPMVATESIGGYRAEFHPQQDGGINASVEDTDGALDLAGRIALAPDRSYQFRGLIAAKPETPASLRQQLRFLGTPNDRGQHELNLDGQL